MMNATERNADPVAFRDRMAHVIRSHGLNADLHAYEMADWIMAMPEMCDVRAALGTLERLGGPGYLAYLDIPQSVIDWATS